MGTFTAAAIICAYEDIAEDLGVPIQRVSYLTSLQIAILGGAPLFWKPLSHRFGRRPIFLLSLVLSGICNIGCAKSTDYASMAACRALVSFFISPAMAIGSSVVTETFFKHERARYMGVWTLMVTLGVPTGPFIFGFVTQRVGYRWIYWILAIVSIRPRKIKNKYSLLIVYLDQCYRVHPLHWLRTRDPLYRCRRAVSVICIQDRVHVSPTD
jgi:MFS family permease